jgi:hypothetical protein
VWLITQPALQSLQLMEYFLSRIITMQCPGGAYVLFLGPDNFKIFSEDENTINL